MPDQWEEAAKAFKPAAAQSAATAPANEDWKVWNSKGEPEKPGFFSSAWDTIKHGPANLLAAGNAINGFVAHPSTILPAVRGMGQQTIDLGKDAVGSFRKGDVVGGIRKGLNTGINAVVPGLGAQSEDAGREFDKGNTAAGFGKTVGVGVNTALGLGTPKIANGAAEVVANAPRAVRAVGSGLKAAAPDLATGGAMIAGGEALAQIPGMSYPARIGIGLPGATMIGRALKQGAAATREAFSGPVAPEAIPPSAPEPFRASQTIAKRYAQSGPSSAPYDPSSDLMTPARPTPSAGFLRSRAERMAPEAMPEAPAPQAPEPFRPSPSLMKRYAQSGGSKPYDPTAEMQSPKPNPMGGRKGAGPLPSGPREVVVQHKGDPRLPGRAPDDPKMFDSFGRQLPRPNRWK